MYTLAPTDICIVQEGMLRIVRPGVGTELSPHYSSECSVCVRGLASVCVRVKQDVRLCFLAGCRQEKGVPAVAGLTPGPVRRQFFKWCIIGWVFDEVVGVCRFVLISVLSLRPHRFAVFQRGCFIKWMHVFWSIDPSRCAWVAASGKNYNWRQLFLHFAGFFLRPICPKR